VRIPEAWQHEIDNDTAFGKRVLAAMSRVAATQTETVGTPATGAGTKILTMIEGNTGNAITANACLQYIHTLNTAISPLDCDEIVPKLATVLPLPAHIQKQHNTRQKRQDWLRPIVEAALLSWVDDAPLQAPAPATTVNAESSSSV